MSDLHAELLQFFFWIKKVFNDFYELIYSSCDQCQELVYMSIHNVDDGKKIAHNSCCFIQVTIKTKANEYWAGSTRLMSHTSSSEVSCLPAIVMKETLFLAYMISQSGYVVVSIVCPSIHKNRYNSLQYWPEFKETCYSDDLHTDFSQTQRHICRSQWISILFFYATHPTSKPRKLITF